MLIRTRDGPDQLDQGSIPPFLSEDQFLYLVLLIFERNLQHGDLRIHPPAPTS